MIAFSKWDGFKMKGSSIGLGKKWQLQYAVAVYLKDVSVGNMGEAVLIWHKGKKHRKVFFWQMC